MALPRRRYAGALLPLVLGIAQALSLAPQAHGVDVTSPCRTRPVSEPYLEGLSRTLEAKRDVWGERLLAAPNGPTLAHASRYLAPLLYARGPGGRSLTTSGVYYLPLAMPTSLYGEKAFALHVADGSEIITRRIGGPSLRIVVGSSGRHELYGSCLSRLTPARLAGGYLPIVRTAYVDSSGVRYRQESFAGRVPGVRSLVSFVRLSVDTRSARSGATVRFVSSGGRRLVVGRRRTLDGASVGFHVTDRAELYAAWVHQPDPTSNLTANRATYDEARRAVVRFWEGQLDPPRFVVPEEQVLDAERSLLIQQSVLTWRYSIGNPYEELSFAEALDTAQVMASYGYDDVSKAILRLALRRLPERYSNWRAGASLLAAATYHRLVDDPRFLEEERPGLVEAVRGLARQIDRPGSSGLLDREPYSSDIQRNVIALHGQIVVWQGLEAMSRVWARTGHPGLAARSRSAARRLEAALRRAVAASKRRLPDGSLFVPAALLDGGEPFDRLTASREGSYWNLVTPYALASGFFPAHGAQARALESYLRGHGSRLLGLVRAGAYRLRGSAPITSGTDQVYGLNVSRFLADNDEPDQLVLSLYGTLAAGMTRGTYVSGESATVIPVDGARTMYLPPNGGTNATFLETLRLSLVHETRGPEGAPRGLELAFATPRRWLADGKVIRVENAPTSFGPLSYSITRAGPTIRAVVEAPPTPSLELRLRLPSGDALADVRLGGRSVPFDRSTATVDLPTRGARLVLEITVRRGAPSTSGSG